MEWSIRRQGQNWIGPEGLQKLIQMPGRLELAHGKLCVDEAERRTLLAGLLENVGMDEVLAFGDIHDWREALAERAEAEGQCADDGTPPAPRSHWNCRVIASIQSDGESHFAVHEVYYVNGFPTSRSETGAVLEWCSDDGTDGGERRLAKLREALRKPMLTDADFTR